MFCKNCGKEIDDKAAICIYCGVATDNMPKDEGRVLKKGVNGLAIAGFVLALVGLFGGNYLFLIPSIVGLPLSIVGMVKIRSHTCGGLAIAGLIINLISFAIWLLVWIMAFEMIASGLV